MKKIPKINEFAVLVREHREKARISQRKLAGLVGISPTGMNHLEQGFYDPSCEMVLKICEVLNMDTYSALCASNKLADFAARIIKTDPAVQGAVVEKMKTRGYL